MSAFCLDSDIEESPRRASPPDKQRERAPRTPHSKSRLATPGRTTVTNDSPVVVKADGPAVHLADQSNGCMPDRPADSQELSKGTEGTRPDEISQDTPVNAKKPVVLRRVRKGQESNHKPRQTKHAASKSVAASKIYMLPDDDLPAEADEPGSAIDLDSYEDKTVVKQLAGRKARTAARGNKRQRSDGGGESERAKKCAGRNARSEKAAEAGPVPIDDSSDEAGSSPEPESPSSPVTMSRRRRPTRAAAKVVGSPASNQSSEFEPPSSSDEETPQRNKRPGRRAAKEAGVGQEFFMTAAQKRRRRELAEAESAQQLRLQAVEQLLAEKRQRKEERMAFRGDRRENPFFKPRLAVTVASDTASGDSGVAVREPPRLLPPPMPPIHITQDCCAHRPGAPPTWPAGVLSDAHPKLQGVKSLLAAATEQPGIMLWSPATAAASHAPSCAVEWLPVEGVAPAAVSDPASNALWTERYRPAEAARVCGNQPVVAELLSWLRDWKPGGGAAARAEAPEHGSESDEEWLQRGVGRKYYRGLSDDEEDLEDGGAQPACNAAWLSGPTGCGKSAAIAAAAWELGLRILEVNPGSHRSGASVLRSIGEATQSSRLTAPTEALLVGQSRADAGEGHCGGATLLVFEEVDSLVEEDKGFLAALAGLVLGSKRPILMTSNNAQPPPPLAALNLRRLPFQLPTAQQAASCIAAILAAEGQTLPSHQIADTPGDVRRAILQAQLDAPRASAVTPPEPAFTDGWWGTEANTAAPALKMLSQAEEYLSALDCLWKPDEAAACVLGDDCEWREAGPEGGAAPLPHEYPSLYRSLLRATTEGRLFPDHSLRRSGRSPAVLFEEIFGGTAPQRIAAAAEERASVAMAVAKMAAVEADRKEAEELCPRSPRRGGRRRRVRWYLEDDACLSARSIAAGVELHESANFSGIV